MKNTLYMKTSRGSSDLKRTTYLKSIFLRLKVKGWSIYF